MKWLLSSDHTKNYCSGMQRLFFPSELFKLSADARLSHFHERPTVHLSAVLDKSQLPAYCLSSKVLQCLTNTTLTVKVS
jgi:hypothetical protein